MGEVVNLKRVRKRIAREQATAEADTNRAKFGRSKSERVREDARSRRNETLLDQHRIDREDKS